MNAVEIRVGRRTGAAGVHWVEPVGWTPDVSAFLRGDKMIWEGAVWAEGVEEEIAGLAVASVDLGQAAEGDAVLIDLRRLFYFDGTANRRVTVPVRVA